MAFHDKTTPDAQTLIQSIVNAEIIFQRQRSSGGGTPPVVALSHDYGAGGRDIARALCRSLGVELYERQILERIAAASHIDIEQLAALGDTAGAHKLTSWIRGLFSASTAYPEAYRYHLVNVVLDVSRGGGVILDHGAHVILATRPVFRVRVVGSEEGCAERVAARDGITLDEARVKVCQVNAERDAYLFNLFNRHLHDASQFDLVVNTDQFPDMDTVAELILIAMALSGHTVPSSPGNAR